LRVSDCHDLGHLFIPTEVNMTKLISIIAASALALSLSGVAFSADTQDQNTPKTQDQSNSPRPQDPNSAPPDQAKQDQDYLVALKRCEELQDASKQKCIDKAKQKYNRM
jgi:hypothetical protein